MSWIDHVHYKLFRKSSIIRSYGGSWLTVITVYWDSWDTARDIIGGALLIAILIIVIVLMISL